MKNKISFTRPDQLGTVFQIEGNRYELHKPGQRLTDEFLDEILLLIKNNTTSITLNFADGNIEPYCEQYTFIFHDSGKLTISSENDEKEYDLAFLDFANAFVENVRKYALYYAAPCNYRAIMEKPFDEMVKKMNTYRLEEKAILEKLM